MIKEIEYPAYANSAFQRISWGAVFAGTIMSLAVLATLTSLGAGIGLVTAPSAVAQGSGIGMGIGSGVWMLLSGVISFYAGGWIAGRLTGIARVSESVIHGLVSWGLSTVIMAFFFATATVGALSAAANVVGGGIGAPADVGAAGLPPLGVEDAAKGAKAAGAAGLFAFFMLACDAAAAAAGARSGTRVLRPVSVGETRTRERAL